MVTDRLHKHLQIPRVLIGARVKSNTDPVADGFHRVRGQARLGFAIRAALSSTHLPCKMQFGHFDFDFVHDQNCGQEDVFYTTVRPLVHKLIEVCMLAPSTISVRAYPASCSVTASLLLQVILDHAC